MLRTTLIVLLLLVPGVSAAAVTINEIAWMGTNASANDEWIELHNDGGSAVSLNGWRITDNANFDVTLDGAGSVAAGAYVVLERTDDSSSPGSAFYIYTGSLPNTGATLRLYDAGGNLVDQVAGGENWENIGGNNNTKDTAQYSTSGWITAAPTPGSANATEASVIEEETDSSNTTNKTSGGGSGEPARRTTDTTHQSSAPFGAAIKAPTTGFVAQPITFYATLSGRGASSRAGRELTWNFGDTYTDTGGEVTHQYQYPGTYIVSLRGEYKGEEVHIRHEITVLPVQLAITRNREGAVQLSNTAPNELALGDFTVTAADSDYTLPPDTYLKANGAITLPPSVLPVTSQQVVAVHDQSNAVVAYQLPRPARDTHVSVEKTPTPIVARAPTTPTPVAITPAPSQFSFASTQDTPEEPAAESPVITTANAAAPATVIEALPPAAAAASAEARALTTNRLAYLGLVGVLLLAVFALLARRQHHHEPDIHNYH